MSMNAFHSRNARPAAAPARQEKPSPQRTGVRADLLLVATGLAPSRPVARRLIEAGLVHGPHGPITKPAQTLAPGTLLTVRTAE